MSLLLKCHSCHMSVFIFCVYFLCICVYFLCLFSVCSYVRVGDCWAAPVAQAKLGGGGGGVSIAKPCLFSVCLCLFSAFIFCVSVFIFCVYILCVSVYFLCLFSVCLCLFSVFIFFVY